METQHYGQVTQVYTFIYMGIATHVNKFNHCELNIYDHRIQKYSSNVRT